MFSHLGAMATDCCIVLELDFDKQCMYMFKEKAINANNCNSDSDNIL